MSPALCRSLLSRLAGTAIPARWFFESARIHIAPEPCHAPVHIEIVSHCWQYSRLLAYQLTSLVDHPPDNARITMTVFYSEDDIDTGALLDWFAPQQPVNVTWNFQVLPRQQLFRRSVGRNLAALASTADWVWFTDCDMTFQSSCLDHLAAALVGRTDALVYPAVEAKTDVYSDEDEVTRNSLATPAHLRIEAERFRAYPVTRATGPLQITHGDVARARGYCKDVSCYQQAHEHFQKATEDRVFRWLLGTPGIPIDVPGVCRVQHASKGRYEGRPERARWRRRVRQWQHAWRHR